MEQTLVGILISWGPMLLLIGVWVYFMRRFRGPQQAQQEYMGQVKTYISEHLAETRRLNQNLERIASALEQKRP